MNIKVVWQNNKEGFINSMLLDRMIEWERIRMFMRSDGWAMVGISPLRGTGGAYHGPDRRGMYGISDNAAYRIVA